MLTYHNMGWGGSLGPMYTEICDSFDEDRIEVIFRIKEFSKGRFKLVKRPDFSSYLLRENTNYRLPNDFLRLTNKLFSLDETNRNKFLNACLSYQYALAS